MYVNNPTDGRDAFGQLGLQMLSDQIRFDIINSIVHYWGFNGSNFLTDSIGTADLTNVGSVTQVSSTFKEGTHSSQYNGINYFTIGDLSTVEPNQDFSVSAWIKDTDDTTFRFIASKDKVTSPQDRGWSLVIVHTAGGGPRLRFSFGVGTSAVDLDCNNTVTFSEWNHIVGTHDLSTKTIKIYVNGTDIATTTYGFTAAATVTPAYIGRSEGGNILASGSKVDQVIFYNKVLTDEEALYIFNNPNFYPN